ncbi:hypothetical protein FRB95_001119 [Tulasnella sp. JGI-2019a]|nr:hypothetical protein FRB95_001119 [Tulasnella sp. JGI-2019a]
MSRPTNETMDHALSILALSLHHKHRLNYDFFASNPFGSPEEVDRDVQLMQTAQSNLNDHISSIISQRRTYRNTIASRIYTIPLEILTRILSELIEDDEWNPERLHALACVSKYWSSIVLSTPQLWTVVKYDTGQYSRNKPPLWKLALKKSMQLPISCQIHAPE